jgi:hypothetical protein
MFKKGLLLQNVNQDENFHGQRGIRQKILILKGKLKIELGEKLVRCNVWSIALYGSDT